MINTESANFTLKVAITTKNTAMVLLLLLGPLRDAVACALQKSGGTDDSRKLRTTIGLRGVAYAQKLERIAFLPRNYSIQPVVIAYA